MFTFRTSHVSVDHFPLFFLLSTSYFPQTERRNLIMACNVCLSKSLEVYAGWLPDLISFRVNAEVVNNVKMKYRGHGRAYKDPRGGVRTCELTVLMVWPFGLFYR